ncbi:branched-chain amino acid transport system ATP-binding protein [Amycolatopsis bartoniae]|uniref:ABC transporter ATP-binding protein n=1 Tax=Amycolatopsis bartoniae TaxID=941986 RepID=A0A8H9IX76_9PSEU|nr:ABC transporter ATP-binding protein [Amycolatopsis bartoniae]MBB2937898.1 branched-chain amino acid transport system ATP-binding protein [Amycolatopsis bartoniae]TVT08606.1 ABC transporter ATP-binding protein [Amycolatopsis bartoniae]GHF41547.1 ABC transporter ATP-binding protein [Amycolatopsis bartoniae]
MSALLELRGLRAYYGTVECLHGVDLTVGDGEVVVVLGANGAGKTTLLRSVCQLVRTEGSVLLSGKQLGGRSTYDVVRRGVAMVPQGRGTLAELSVDDNLRAGGYIRKDKQVRTDIAYWYDTFPRLAQRRSTSAGSLSGGEQQMLAIARALMSRPRLLLLDEPSLGLAPIVVRQLFDVLARVRAEREVAMVVVEQNAALALDLARRAYVLEAGTVAVSGSAAELRDDESVRRAYLGY